MKPDLKSRTYDKRFTIAEWWGWSNMVEINSVGSYRPFIKPGDLVFDVGANRGRKTLIFRWLGARVLAIDPLFEFGNEFVPEFFWRWGKDPDVTVVPKAITDHRGEVPIQCHKNLPYHSSIDHPWMETSAHASYYNKKACVPRVVGCETLTNLINIYGIPAFIKIDVEGHEEAVIAGLEYPVPSLNMEYHQDWLPRAALERLDKLGEYEYTYTLNNAQAFMMDWSSSHALIEQLESTLEEKGPRSWGDIYARLVDG